MHKFWFRMRDGQCLWNRFMLDRYCRNKQPSIAPAHSTHSRVWKNLMKVRESAGNRIHWQLGQGACDLWLDSWFDTSPLSHQFLAQQGGALVQKIRGVFIDHGHQDKVNWKQSRDGSFSFKPTHKEVREGRNVSAIWHSSIPKKMSFLVWRLIHGWVPDNEVLVKRGSSNGFSVLVLSGAGNHRACPHKTSYSSCYILALWEARNKAKHENVSYNYFYIQKRIMNLLATNGTARMNNSKYWFGELVLATSMGMKSFVSNAKVPRLWRNSKGSPTQADFAARFSSTNQTPLQADIDALFF
ncbi:hypothetical protein LIER_13046 [Lithospermum erythrorhizon]|uniref:Reverse transcriptase zinc-binding domain-containing protein n=1 Tax=Lithospermum erythrorhizon TaxID=34254 RepID=A0AAV3PU22_LITER